MIDCALCHGPIIGTKAVQRDDDPKCRDLHPGCDDEAAVCECGALHDALKVTVNYRGHSECPSCKERNHDSRTR